MSFPSYSHEVYKPRQYYGSSALPLTPPLESRINSARHSPAPPPSHPFQPAPSQLGPQQKSLSNHYQNTHSRPFQQYTPPVTTSSSPELRITYPQAHEPAYQTSALAGQRALPLDFPPIQVPMSPTSTTSPLSATSSMSITTWTAQQQHHYTRPSPDQLSNSASSVMMTQDRYICPTCSKAFSRPSSLRIHSHSHTGEKPFRCPSKGCGKAFSVRSNMKRHERGCHVDTKTDGYQNKYGKPVMSGGRNLLPASL